jgi:hypothetical protein
MMTVKRTSSYRKFHLESQPGYRSGLLRQDQFVQALYLARVIVGAGWTDGAARSIVTSVA